MSTEVDDLIDHAVTKWWSERGKKVISRQVKSLVINREVVRLFSILRGCPREFCEECVETLSADVEVAFLAYLVILVSEENRRET